MTHYKQLSNEERFYIWNALRTGSTQKEIAKTLNRNPSTISREVKRNKYAHCKMYTYERALEIVKYRKQRTAQSKYRKMDEKVSNWVTQLIQQYLSPEQVCGYLKAHHEISLSHETVYRFIHANEARRQTLKPFLRQGKKRRRKRYGSGARVSIIPNTVELHLLLDF